MIFTGTPHSFHKENCLSAIAQNKHVLCEKPLTVNAAEADVVIKAAKDKGVFLMEGESIQHHSLAAPLAPVASTAH